MLVVRGTKVTAPMLDAGRLSLIVRAGAGYNTIDVAARLEARHLRLELSRARTRSRSPSWPSALILALDRRIPDNVADLRAGSWNKKEYSKARGPLRPDARRCSASAASARR